MTQLVVYRLAKNSTKVVYEGAAFGTATQYNKTLSVNGASVVGLVPLKVKPFTVSMASKAGIPSMQMDATLNGICEVAGSSVVSLGLVKIAGAGATTPLTKSVNGASTSALDITALLLGPCEVAGFSVVSLATQFIAGHVVQGGAPSRAPRSRFIVNVRGTEVEVNSAAQANQLLQQTKKAPPQPKAAVLTVVQGTPLPPPAAQPIAFQPPLTPDVGMMANALLQHGANALQQIAAEKAARDAQDEDDIEVLLTH